MIILLKNMLVHDLVYCSSEERYEEYTHLQWNSTLEYAEDKASASADVHPQAPAPVLVVTYFGPAQATAMHTTYYY